MQAAGALNFLATTVAADWRLATPLIFAALTVVSVQGLAFYYIVEYAERMLVPWAPKFDPVHAAG